ncbi:phosducin [Coemansia sp. RSA 2675]|nr:phosducin [Coemansia sp. RSA 2675]
MNPEEDTEWNDILRKHGILPQQIKITQNDIYDSAYRQQRLAEIKAQVDKERFGELMHISEPDYKRQVTEASRDSWIVVHLFRDSIPECKLMNRFLGELAQQYRATKFVKIISVECIHNYPDANLPTLLVYGKGDMRGQLVRLDKFGGMRTKRKDIEDYLKGLGAVDPALKRALPGEGADEASDDDDDESNGGSMYFDLSKGI